MDYWGRRLFGYKSALLLANVVSSIAIASSASRHKGTSKCNDEKFVFVMI